MPEKQIIAKTTSIRGLDDTFVQSGQFVPERTLFTTSRNANMETLYRVVKQSPEVAGALLAIVEDIMSDGWKYTGSKSAIEKTKKFALQSSFYKLLSNALFDLLVTGNAYILKLSVLEGDIKQVTEEIRGKLVQELRLMKENGKASKQSVFELINQTFTTPKDLQLLKSSTMKINFDETGKVISYQQTVNSATRAYRPEDVIHLSLLNVGGEPYGFTPLEPLLSDLATLIFAKNYAGSFFENDGVPYFLFKMPEEHPNSPNYKKLKQELKELKDKSQKFRSLVLTGNVEADQIQKFNKDMEFANLIQHFTQIVLIALGVPTYRINWTMTTKAQGGEINRAFEGYYKKIAFLQKLIEETLNVDLFESYKTELKFNRAYKIDEMREAQIVQILTQVGAITIEEAREMMGLDPEKPKGTEPNATGDQNNINFAQDKKTTQGQDNNPQQPDKNTDNQLKSIELNMLREGYATKHLELQGLQELAKVDIEKKTKEFADTANKVIEAKQAELLELKSKVDSEIQAKQEVANKEIKEKLTKADTLVEGLLAKQELLEKQIEMLARKRTSKVNDYVDISSFMRFKFIVEAYSDFQKAKILYQDGDEELTFFFNDGTWKYRAKVLKKDIDPVKFIQNEVPFAVKIE